VASVRVLLFTRVAGYRHDSLPAAVAALSGLPGLSVSVSDDPALGSLRGVDVVAFVSTTGDVLSARGRDALRSFAEAGGGFAGVHAAADGEWSWDWYPELVGARFAGHPPGLQDAVAVVEDGGHPSTAGLPARWAFRDEWYAFDDVRPGNHLLLSVDEATYAPGEHATAAPHPVSWWRSVAAGRSWYTSLGHDAAAWAVPAFLDHVAGGLRWAAGRGPGEV
jgi:type 1 glutamine amidotransferase